MHERTPQDSENKDDDQSPEQEPRQSPRIYVASLADYNEGRLYGAWIDAAQDPDDLGKAVEQMLAAAPRPCAEEWAIHDYEGFGLLHLHEFEKLEDVAKVAAGIHRHGPAFSAWAAHVGIDSELLDRFEDAYMGEWADGTEFAKQMIDDMGEFKEVKDRLPQHLACYVDINYDDFFDGLVLGGEIWFMEKLDGGVYVFRNW